MSKNWKKNVDLEAYAVAASEQLHHQDDLPDEREPGARRRHEVGVELRQVHLEERAEPRDPVHLRDLHEIAVHRLRTLPHGDHHRRDLVHRHRKHRRGLGEAEPDVAEDDGDQGGDVEPEDQDAVERHVDPLGPAHDDADGGPHRHGDGEGDRDPGQRNHQVMTELTARGVLPQERHHRGRGRQQIARRHRGGDLPDDHEAQQRQASQPDSRAPGRYCCHRAGSNSVQNVPGSSVSLAPTSFSPPSAARIAKARAAASRSASSNRRGIPSR